MKKIAAILIFITILNISSLAYSNATEPFFSEKLDLTGESAILIDRDSGKVLYEKNSHKRSFPASTTKIMTGILAIEEGELNDIVTIGEEVIEGLDGTHIALEPGEQLTLKELLYALLVESANDAAVAIAIHISGSVESFVDLMNNKAKELGALDTHFVNPNGLPDDNHVSTAYDLSLIANYAMKNDIFSDIVKEYYYIIPETNKKDEERYLKSSNRLLYSNQKIDINGQSRPIKYEGINGIKSGYTVAAQQCLVSSATRKGQRLIAVVLKSEGRDIYSDSHKLLNYGFENFENISLSSVNQFVDNIPVKKGTSSFVAGIVKDNIITTVPKGNMEKVEKKITIFEDNVAPIKKGETLGKIEYFLNDEKLEEADIIATLDVDKMPIKKIILNKLGDIWWVVVIILFIIRRINTITRKKKMRKKRKIHI